MQDQGVEAWEDARRGVIEIFPKAFVSVTDYAVRVFRGTDDEKWGEPLSRVEIARGLGINTVPKAWLEAQAKVYKERA